MSKIINIFKFIIINGTIFIGCFIAVLCLFLLGIIAASYDNFVLGTIFGISLVMYPFWLNNNFKNHIKNL